MDPDRHGQMLVRIQEVTSSKIKLKIAATKSERILVFNALTVIYFFYFYCSISRILFIFFDFIISAAFLEFN